MLTNIVLRKITKRPSQRNTSMHISQMIHETADDCTFTSGSLRYYQQALRQHSTLSKKLKYY